MAVNRRLIIWLIKAYIKRWRKTIALFFVLGLAAFFVLRFFLSTIVAKFPVVQKEYIGMVGAYRVDTLPTAILEEVSHGLTKIDESGSPKPDLASSWEIKNNGKLYVFHLKPNQFFADGTRLTSDKIKLSFSDVTIIRPNDTTIAFQLKTKEPYAPFLITMSEPLFINGLVGINGTYQVKDINLNGSFIASLTITGVKEQFKVKVYQFYPTQEALRLAFVLGNISQAAGLTDLMFKDTSLTTFPNATTTKETNYHQLVTLFYNTQDAIVSDKRLRDALSYALPNSFPEGERASSPLSPTSWAYQADFLRTQDIEHAKLLLKTVEGTTASMSALTISTLPRYKKTAEAIQNSWKLIGIKTTIKVVTTAPDTFQIFLGNFNVPRDPDQYTLWHSLQPNNISGYKSLRIDKLLEDGRSTLDQNKRLKIYSDFQKYLLDDQPASFLYFPYTYTVTRK